MRTKMRQLTVLVLAISAAVVINTVSRQVVRANPAGVCEVPKAFGGLKATLAAAEFKALRMPKSTGYLVFEDADGVIRLVSLDTCSVAVTIQRS